MKATLERLWQCHYRRRGRIEVLAKPMLKHKERPNSVRMIVAATVMLGEHFRNGPWAEQAAITELAAAECLRNESTQWPRAAQPVLERHGVPHLVRAVIDY